MRRLARLANWLAPTDPAVIRAYTYLFATLAGFLGGYFLGFGDRSLRESVISPPDPAQEARGDTIRQLGDSLDVAVGKADSIRVDTVRVVEARADSAMLTKRLDSLLAASDSITRVKVGVAVEIATAATRGPLLAVIERQEDELVALRRGLLFARRRSSLLEASLDVEKLKAIALATENLRLQGRIDELSKQRNLAAGFGLLTGAGFGFLAAR